MFSELSGMTGTVSSLSCWLSLASMPMDVELPGAQCGENPPKLS